MLVKAPVRNDHVNHLRASSDLELKQGFLTSIPGVHSLQCAPEPKNVGAAKVMQSRCQDIEAAPQRTELILHRVLRRSAECE